MISILGGGAAGFFAALSCKHHYPDTEVIIFEKSDKLLAKVKVSGGGRCNVTHACFSVAQLVKNYPRGQKELRKPFEIFNTTHTIDWFQQRGVALKTEEDGRMFPVTDQSQTIIDCLINEARRLGIIIKKNCGINRLEKSEGDFSLTLADGSLMKAQKVIVATGGSPKKEGFAWLEAFGHTIVDPVPSLFTFNIPGDNITSLMGVSVDQAIVWIEGTKLKQAGPVLITHWGLSGPAILKLSAFGARELYHLHYTCTVHINWTGFNEEEVRKTMQETVSLSLQKKVSNTRLFDLPSRLWLYLLQLAEIHEDIRWSELKKDNRNRLIKYLTNHEFVMKGKTTFKEEFVTCGGVSLNDVNMQTMESKVLPGLFFAGEVLDIDGVTGGFNFQAAWTMGYLAGKLGT